jgi:hypothetical protein
MKCRYLDNPLPIGTVFSKTVIKTKYWKITGNPRSSFSKEYYVYPVVRCTKTGKEFKETNGFDVNAVHENKDTFKIIGIVSIGTKANIDNGNKIGAMKRRIDYLNARILRDRDKIKSIECDLFQLDSSYVPAGIN